MCQHPRCGKMGKYLLTGTPHGKIELCGMHGQLYKQNHGGELTLTGEAALRKKEREGRRQFS